MSIVRLCTRVAATRALRDGLTLIDGKVDDSSLSDIETAAETAPKPVVIVYTDDDDARPNGKSIGGGQGTLSLIFLISVTGSITVQAKGEDGQPLKDDAGNDVMEREYYLPTTSAAIEMSLDLIERQIQTTLMDPTNAWSQTFWRLVTSVTRWRSIRGGSTKEGVRLAARQIIVDCETVHDWPMGSPPEHDWKLILDQFEAAGPDLAGQAGIIRKALEGKPLEPWQRTMAEMGWTPELMRGAGMTPISDTPITLERVTFQPEGVTLTPDTLEPDDGN